MLSKLTGTNFIKLIAQWRDMWNGQVLEHLRSMELTAGSGIQLQKKSNGTLISVIGRSGGGAPSEEPDTGYKGMFLVISDTTEEDVIRQVKVVDGAQPDFVYCGRTELDGYVRAVSLSVSAGSIVFVRAEYDLAGRRYLVTLEAGFELPTAPGVGYYELARISADGRQIIQVWQDNVMYFGKRYFI